MNVSIVCGRSKDVESRRERQRRIANPFFLGTPCQDGRPGACTFLTVAESIDTRQPPSRFARKRRLRHRRRDHVDGTVGRRVHTSHRVLCQGGVFFVRGICLARHHLCHLGAELLYKMLASALHFTVTKEKIL